MGPTWGPPGAARTQVGSMLATWTLLSGTVLLYIYDVYPIKYAQFCCTYMRERDIKFIGLFENRGHQGPYSPYKPFNHNLYIGIITYMRVYPIVYAQFWCTYMRVYPITYAQFCCIYMRVYPIKYAQFCCSYMRVYPVKYAVLLQLYVSISHKICSLVAVIWDYIP